MKLKQCPALGNSEQGKMPLIDSSRTAADEMLEASE